MTEIKGTTAPDLDNLLVEERFLLQVQVAIQTLLNEKKLRYRDLAKRLGVSESRVSQMFGDDGANLTIRTIARIFHQLGEEAAVVSQRSLGCLTGESADPHVANDHHLWHLAAGDFGASFDIARAQFVEEMDDSTSVRAPRHRDWIEAEPAMRRA